MEDRELLKIKKTIEDEAWLLSNNQYSGDDLCIAIGMFRAANIITNYILNGGDEKCQK